MKWHDVSVSTLFKGGRKKVQSWQALPDCLILDYMYLVPITAELRRGSVLTTHASYIQYTYAFNASSVGKPVRK